MRVFEPYAVLEAVFLYEMRLQFLHPPSGVALTMTPLYWTDEGSIFAQLYLRSKHSAVLELTPKPNP